MTETTIEVYHDKLESFLVSSFQKFLIEMEEINCTVEEELSEIKKWICEKIEPLFPLQKIPKEFKHLLDKISSKIEELEIMSFQYYKRTNPISTIK